MPASLLEILRSIPDRRRAEGKRFDLATVLHYSILGMVAGANSYRQMHEFIRIHRQRLNEAFGLALRGAPSYTGLRDILQGRRCGRAGGGVSGACVVDCDPDRRRDGHRRRWQDAARQLRRLRRQKAAHMLSALRHADQIVLGHMMVEEKSNEIPAAPELIEALGLRGCVFTLDAEHCQKNSSGA